MRRGGPGAGRSIGGGCGQAGGVDGLLRQLVVPPGSFQPVLRMLFFSRTQSTSPFGLITRPPQPTMCVAKAGTGHDASVGSQRRSIAWQDRGSSCVGRVLPSGPDGTG